MLWRRTGLVVLGDFAKHAKLIGPPAEVEGVAAVPHVFHHLLRITRGLRGGGRHLAAKPLFPLGANLKKEKKRRKKKKNDAGEDKIAGQ